MNRIKLRSIALAALLAGAGIVALWHFAPSISVVDNAPNRSDCLPSYADFDVADFKGVITRRVFVFDSDKTSKSASDEDANAEATADLFRRFRETPLAKQPACVDESYRLVWIPTFRPPTVIRVWRTNDKYFVVVKRLNGKGGYDPGELANEETRSLTAEEWRSLTAAVDQTGFLRLPSTVEEPIPNDGATWTFEGWSNRQYHFVHRITPSEELERLFTKMLNLTGMETENGRVTKDLWWSYLASYEAGPGSIRVNLGLRKHVPLAGFPYLVITGTTYGTTRKDGLPDAKDLERLDALAEKVIDAIRARTPSVYVGTFTHDREQLHYVYVSDPSGLAGALDEVYSAVCGGCKTYKNIKYDPEWADYTEFLYPNQATIEFHRDELEKIGLFLK